jgi:hypothetical protein
MTYIAKRHRAYYGIHNGVQENVGIGMTEKSL